MTVYVDDYRIPATVGRITARWSHLTADTETELRTFAARLGLRVSWIQHPGTPIVHFDVTDALRLRAIGLGAKPITIRESGELVRARRDVLGRTAGGAR